MIKRVYIEITNQCNLACAFCSGNHRPIHAMSSAEFESVLRQVKPLTDYIYLHVQGEPLLHPDIRSLFELCDQYQMQVQLVTNGSLLDRHFDLLNYSSLRRISLSLQSLPYQQIDVASYMDTVLAWIRAAADTPVITELRLWRSDEQNDEITQYCLSRLRESFPFTASERKNSFRLSDRVFLSYANDFEWPSESDVSLTESVCSGTCLGVREQLAILSDRTVVPCCLDADGHVPLGSLQEKTLADILASERCQSLIHQFRSHRITEPFCQTCTYRHRFD